MSTTMSAESAGVRSRAAARPTRAPAKQDRMRRFALLLVQQRDAQISRMAEIDGSAYLSHRLAGDEQIVVAQMESTRRLIADSEAALQRIESGTYGRCEKCSAQIPEERLEILPHARYCVSCQGRMDGRTG